MIEAPRDGPNQWCIGLLVVGPRHPHTLHARAGCKIARQARDIAGQPISVRIEDAGEMDAAGILPKMIVERGDPAVGRQRGKKIDLRGNHAIGTGDQVIIDLEVDEAEQDRDERRKQRRQCGGPVKGVRAYELHLILRTLPPDCLAGPDDAGARHDRPKTLRAK